METDITLQEILKDIERELTDPSIIADNKIPFKYNEAYYRVRMPNQLEESIAQTEKSTLFGKLIQTDGYYMKKRLAQILKEKQGIDLEALEDTKNKINVKIQDYRLILAQKRDEEVQTIEDLRNKILDLTNQRIQVSIEIGKYLSNSIEDKLEQTYVQALGALCTEKLEIVDGQEKWNKVWSSIQDFQKDTTPLVPKVISFMTYLIMNTRSY